MSDAPPVGAPRQRQAGLDLLRLLAILLVLGRHLDVVPERAPAAGRVFFAAWARGGWVGVDLFFVLSGFLVSGLLFAEYRSRGRLSPLRFYTRRGWKIYPPFLVLIASSIMLLDVVAGEAPPRSTVLSELLFLQGYRDGLWNHTWSLAIEEHFYLALPLLLTLILRINRRARDPLRPVVSLGIVIVIAELAVRLANWRFRPAYSHLTHLYPTHLRLDSLFVGVVVSYLYHFHGHRFADLLTPRRWLLIGGGVALLTPAFVLQLERSPFIFTVGFTLFSVASAMLVVGVILCRAPRRGPIVELAALGAYSYSIYLWHLPVMSWGVPLVEQAAGFRFAWGLRTVLAVAGSLASGVLMAKLIETPALRVRDRWFPSRTAGALEVAGQATGWRAVPVALVGPDLQPDTPGR